MVVTGHTTGETLHLPHQAVPSAVQSSLASQGRCVRAAGAAEQAPTPAGWRRGSCTALESVPDAAGGGKGGGQLIGEAKDGHVVRTGQGLPRPDPGSCSQLQPAAASCSRAGSPTPDELSSQVMSRVARPGQRKGKGD